MPAAGRESVEQGCSGGLWVEVKGLRIEFPREGADFLVRDFCGGRIESLADRVIVQPASAHFDFFPGRFAPCAVPPPRCSCAVERISRDSRRSVTARERIMAPTSVDMSWSADFRG